MMKHSINQIRNYPKLLTIGHWVIFLESLPLLSPLVPGGLLRRNHPLCFPGYNKI